MVSYDDADTSLKRAEPLCDCSFVFVFLTSSAKGHTTEDGRRAGEVAL